MKTYKENTIIIGGGFAGIEIAEQLLRSGYGSNII